MVVRPIENFLQASKGPTFMKISTFYTVFGTSTHLSRVSTKYQKLPPFPFLVKIILSVGHMGSKIISITSLDPREHVRYPQHVMDCYRTVSKAIRSEFSKISKSNFLWANSLCFCSKSATKPLRLLPKMTFLDFIKVTSNGFRNRSIPFQDMLWVFSMFSRIYRTHKKQFWMCITDQIQLGAIN